MMNGVSLMETNHLVSISLRALLSIHQALHVSLVYLSRLSSRPSCCLLVACCSQLKLSNSRRRKILIKTPAFALLLKTSVRSQKSGVSTLKSRPIRGTVGPLQTLVFTDHFELCFPPRCRQLLKTNYMQQMSH